MIKSDQLVLDLPFRTALGRANFFVTKSNEEAVGWLDRWPDWPGSALYLYGPEGCGKSHLTHVWSTRAQAILIKPAQLTIDAVPEIAAHGSVALDQADNLVEPEALLHLYNLLCEQGGYLLLACRTPPGELQLPLADLRSRLMATFSVGILPPDDKLLMAVMAKLFADRQVRVGQDVLSFLAARIERSFIAAESAVNRLDQVSLTGRRPITVHTASEAISSFEEV